MESYYEEQKIYNKGVPFPFMGQIQASQKLTGLITSAHIHDYIEILYGISERIQVILNGKSYILEEGDMIIINSREVHKIIGQANQAPIQYLVIKFEPAVLHTTTKTIFEAKYVLPFTLSKSTHQKLFKHEEIESTYIPTLLFEIVEEFKERKYGYELAVRTNICRIFLWVLRRWNEKGLDLNIENQLNEHTMERLQKVFDYVENNYHENITVATVAKLCNMSYSYFSRFFKAVMQKSFIEYLNYIRITKAENLLTTTDLNITEIAQEIGFSTSSYFIQQFKHFKDISPKQFKNYIRGSYSPKHKDANIPVSTR